jgi:Fe-S cluster assembly protein SufD
MALIRISQPAAVPLVLADTEAQVEVAPGIRAELHETTGMRRLALVLAEDASVSLHAAPDAAVEREVLLAGAGSRFELIERFVQRGRDELRSHTTVTHQAPRTVSRLDTRGIAADASRADVRGLIRIRKDALHADSFLAQHALVLDADARAVALPYLEIEHNDVKAGHAATVSRLDAEQLFYLRSRGIPEPDARALLAQAFLRLDALAPGLRGALQERLCRAVRLEVAHAG